MATPDPVTEGAEYRRMLLDLLGEQDPFAVQSRTPGALRGLIGEAGNRLRRRPEANEWSVLECVAHVVDAEVVSAARYRWVLAHDAPELIGYDQDRWVERLRHNEADPEDLLQLFDALRQANLSLWQATPDAERDRYGMHRERGKESYGEMFALYAGHDIFHLAQARRALT